MIRFYLLLTWIWLAGCSSGVVSHSELQSFILLSDNGLNQTAEIGDIRVNITYRPADLFVYQEVDGGRTTQEELDSLRAKYSANHYFILSISGNDREILHQAKDAIQFNELLQTMSFRMQQYATLTTAKQDTIPVADFMLNRTYGLGSSTEVLLAFDKNVEIGGWLQFNLDEFGLGIGNQRFRFSMSDLEKIPRLDFNQTINRDFKVGL